MGGAAAAGASLTTCRAMSQWCASPLPPCKLVFSRLSVGEFPIRKGLGSPWSGWKECAWWGISRREREGSRALNWTCRSSLETRSSGKNTSDGGENRGGAKSAFSIPVLERDENGNIFIRQQSQQDARLTESDETRSNSSAGGSRPSRPGVKAKVITEESKKSSVSGKASSTSTSRPSGSVKANLPSLDPRARRLASAGRVANKGAPLYSKAARRFYNEKFRAQAQRLSKVLAAAGVASRRNCEEVIFEGRVAVNGNICKVPQTPVDPLKDIIYVDGRSLPKKTAPKLYFALNKPKGYICSAGEEGTKPVLSLFDDYLNVWAQRNPGLAKPRMFTVGRLDVATSGLLLVTNDGDFAQKVSHPSSGLTKEYVATVNERVTKRQLQAIASGTMVQGVQCVPKEVEPLLIEAGDERQRVRIVVSEGRNHEVRHLVENSGLQILGLKRIRIGGLRLSRKLGIGKFDALTEAEVANVLKKKSQAP